jgi:hypothetical protein
MLLQTITSIGSVWNPQRQSSWPFPIDIPCRLLQLELQCKELRVICGLNEVSVDSATAERRMNSLWRTTLATYTFALSNYA